MERRDNSPPLVLDLSPAPPPDEGPPGAKYALRNPAYLPAQIGGIVGSYAFSLVLVAIILLSLAKRRREHLRAGEDVGDWEDSNFGFQASEPSYAFKSQDDFQFQGQEHPPQHSFQELPKIHTQNHVQGHVRNFSLPSPTSAQFSTGTREQNPYVLPSPDGSLRGRPGVDANVDQSVVIQDRVMAQAQLEDMYKYVMEQEAAKEAGVEFRGPTFPGAGQQQKQQQQEASSQGMLQKKGRNKPANLNLSGDAKSEKTQSRTSSILSALKSPLGKKKEKVQAISISSPIMTPMTGTFPPQYVGEEMNAIPPRHYAPAVPPPVPAGMAAFSQRRNVQMAPLTPPDDVSPESTQSIDERLRAMAGKVKDRDVRDEYDEDEEEEERQGQGHYYHHSRQQSSMTNEADPISATSETSTTPLVRNERVRDSRASGASGLPSSPKPGVNRFPSLNSLPSSPKPGATFSRPNAPSAVRTGGALPLRAYEPALISPTTYDRTVKQTVFERAGPMSPGGMHTARTPMTGAQVPYSPYQPFSPVVPVTPSLVTKADRKRMRRMEPKTPTMEMVQSSSDIW